jgi:hypothetical protein
MPEPGDEIRQREDEDDHDLLTYGEVGARVTEEIAVQRERVAELERQERAGAEVQDKLSAARRRLDLLRDAARRQSRQPINEQNFERFFGYAGTPRRNT